MSFLPQTLLFPLLVILVMALLHPSIHPSQALGLTSVSISPPPLPIRGCVKHSGSSLAPLKRFEPIEGLFSKKGPNGRLGVGGGARTFPYLLHPHPHPLPPTL